MGIDERLDNLIQEYNPNSEGRINIIRYWRWWGIPGPFSGKATIPLVVDKRIYEEILKATPEECAVSESEYVREAKKWSLIGKN